MSDCTTEYDPALVRRLIMRTQGGLSLEAVPSDWRGRQLGMTPVVLMNMLRQLRHDGLIRRIAAVPNHYRLGYRHNGMTVWDVADEHIDRLGEQLGRLPFISHCYRRPRRSC